MEKDSLKLVKTSKTSENICAFYGEVGVARDIHKVFGRREAANSHLSVSSSAAVSIITIFIDQLGLARHLKSEGNAEV